MKKRYILLIIIALCVGLYWLAYPTYSWNQKLTLTIQTPDGEKTGSAVVNVSVEYQPTFGFGIGERRNEWHGEATVVELGEGHYVFALLGNPVYLATDTFKHLIIPKITRDGNKIINPRSLYPQFKNMRETAPVKSETHYPTLVIFDDIDDPASVRLVDPHNFAATFGEDYVLKAMTLEITDEPVVTGRIEQALHWINDSTLGKNPIWRSLPPLTRTTINNLQNN